MTWPFKTIKQQSEWPMQPLLINLAGTVLSAPEPLRAMLAVKTVERVLRVGARLCKEFGVPPCVYMKLAEEHIVGELGPEAAAHLAQHKADKAVAASVDAVSLADEMNALVTGKTVSN